MNKTKNQDKDTPSYQCQDEILIINQQDRSNQI